MKLKYLGTAAAEGWPALFCNCPSCEKARVLGEKNIRTRSQALIDHKLLIDFCPDTYMHILQHNLNLMAIEHLLVTHSHSDHFYATDLMMRGKPYAHDGEDHVLVIYGNDTVKKVYEHMLAVENDSDNLNKCNVFQEIQPFKTYNIANYQVTPLIAQHDLREKCYIFSIISPDGTALLYGNDTAYFPEITWDYLKDKYFDIVSLDCTMGLVPDCPTHMGLSSNIKTKERLLEIGCADDKTTFIITHFSHNEGLTHEELEEIAGKQGFLVAYDGFEIGGEVHEL